MARRPAPPAKRDRYPRGQGEQLRADLVEAAIVLLAELGNFESLSVRAVTARAGVSPTALYLHFGDKEQFLDAVKDRCFGELRRYVLDAELRAGLDPRVQANAMCLAYLSFAEERPGYYRVLFHLGHRPDLDTGQAPDSLAWPQNAADAFGDLVRGVSRCLTDGRDPVEAATMVWAGLHGLVGLRTMRHFPFPADDHYVRALLDAHLHQHR
jgi:AcrR family transcriptional regulator